MTDTTFLKTITLNTGYMKGDMVDIYKSSYSANNSPALILMDHGTGEPYMTATVNIDAPLMPDYVVVKDYSENEGIFSELVKNGIVEEDYQNIPVGFAIGKLCKLRV